MSKEVTKAKARKNGIIELVVGAGVAALGGIMSYVSYSTAKAGETYTVYTGFIVIGVVYAIKGVIDLIFPNVFNKKKQNDNKESEKATADAEVIKEED